METGSGVRVSGWIGVCECVFVCVFVGLFLCIFFCGWQFLYTCVFVEKKKSEGERKGGEENRSREREGYEE